MKCPGQDTQYWTSHAIFEVPCPECGKTVEFFKDDTTRKCGHCGHRFLNPHLDFGCAAYCQYAEQCLGDLPPELLARKEDLLKDRVALEMKRYFKSDFRRIGHASRVARHAERIGRDEGGNMAVILAAAYLHDIGIPESERRYGRNAPRNHQQVGPQVAREFLERLGAPPPLVDAVCDIIAHHHHPGSEETLEYRVLYDADRITNMEERQKDGAVKPRIVETMITRQMLTESGRREARRVLLSE